MIQVLEECIESEKDKKLKARMQGVVAAMEKFDYFFAISLAYYILKHTDKLASAMQTKGLTAVEGKKMIEIHICPYAL